LLETFDRWLRRAHQTRWLHLLVINLRFLIGFAFVPAGLKKVLDQPFTDPTNHGAFHDFLHAFHATGFFYQFVGATQLLIAVLLITQRFATAGALLATPVLTAITVFCWSTAVYPTATVATLMLLGTLALVVWDLPRWRGGLATEREPPPLDARLWQICGIAILVLYLGVCALSGEIYRPRGVDLGHPGYYVLHLIALAPLVTLVIERARRRARRSST
jgi:uncharacterized membrane protein YphA (DoxX/SURF4 family)